MLPKKSLFRYVLLVIIVLVILLSTRIAYFIYSNHYIVDPSFPGSNPQSNDKSHRIHKAKLFSSVPKSAYVFLALGAQANQLNCLGSIESLVKYAGWDGHVYMLTDRPSCFNVKEILAKSTIQESHFHIVALDEDFSSGGADFKHSSVVGFRMNRMKSFTMKTRIFDFIDASVETIAYVDCDIIFGVEGCATEFITIGESWENYPLRFSRVVKDTQTDNILGIHAGTFVANREGSKKALEIWKNEIEKLEVEGDNDAYMNAYYRLENDRLDGTFNVSVSLESQEKLFIKKHNKSPSVNALLPFEIIGVDSKRYEWFVDPTQDHILCMNHISKARCNNFGRNHIQQFVNHFDLETYEHKYPYCTSPILQPLLYGWFPFRYVPFCPKLETLL